MIAIAYCTGSGHTQRLAELISDGVRRHGGETAMVDVETMDSKAWHALDQADAIILGAPTYMGSVAAAMKVFMDQSSDRWSDQAWLDKLAAGFTVATYASGDKLASLQQMAVFAAQHGMIWIGQHLIGPKGSDIGAVNWQGSNLGLMATSSRDKTVLIDAGDAETAHSFGARVAAAATQWSRSRGG